MSYENQPITKEYLLKRFSDPIVNESHFIKKERKELDNAFKTIKEFNFKHPEYEETTSIPYQYMPENQHEIDLQVQVLIRATAFLESEVIDSAIRLHQSSNGMTTSSIDSMTPDGNRQQQLIQQAVRPSDEQQKGLTGLLRGIIPKKNSENDPYTILIPYLSEKMKSRIQLRRWVEYQFYGIKHATNWGSMKHVFGRHGLHSYLKFHRNRFFELQFPLTTAHQQHVEKISDINKHLLSKMGVSTMQEISQMEKARQFM